MYGDLQVWSATSVIETVQSTNHHLAPERKIIHGDARVLQLFGERAPPVGVQAEEGVGEDEDVATGFGSS
jgi:hypothetical protein